MRGDRRLTATRDSYTDKTRSSLEKVDQANGKDPPWSRSGRQLTAVKGVARARKHPVVLTEVNAASCMRGYKNPVAPQSIG
jgi:hypothetical protein